MCKKGLRKELKFSATEYTYMAKGYYESGLFEKALECVENAYVLFGRDKKAFRGKEEVRICATIYAFIIGKIGKKAEWKKAYDEVEKLCRRDGDVDRYADCLIEKGSVWDDRSATGKAVRLRKKALKVLEEKGGSEKLKAKAYYSLGTTYFKRKKYDLAEQNYQEAFKRGDPEYLLFALGCVKICRGEYAKSLDYLYACSLKREEMCLDMPFHPKLGEIFALIGDVYTLMGLPVKAVKFYVRALYVYEGIDRVSKTSEYKTTLEKLYKTFSALGEKERAESYKRRAEQA